MKIYFFICLFLFLFNFNAITCSEETNYISAPVELEVLQHHLDHILVERVVGTPGHQKVRDYIVQQIEALNTKFFIDHPSFGPLWTIEFDEFSADTPLGPKTFTNIVATLNPQQNAAESIVFAAHYDSKYFPSTPGQPPFLGASDSAVPCVLLLDLAHYLSPLYGYAALLHYNEGLGRSLLSAPALQLVFFDGEEAFVQWTDSDSLYGARHLASEWAAQRRLQKIRFLVLLDLIGAAPMRFWNWFEDTAHLYAMLQEIEPSFRAQPEHGEEAAGWKRFFESDVVPMERYRIQDDHIPFLQRGVPILHLISYPFPKGWHTPEDNLESVSWPDVVAFQQILRQFGLIQGFIGVPPVIEELVEGDDVRPVPDDVEQQVNEEFSQYHNIH